MIEPRLYRAAFLPALLALVVAAFSLEDRPRAVTEGLPADVLFDGGAASSTAGAIVHAAPDRRAGGRGDRATARTVAAALHRAGFATTTDAFDNGSARLLNVVGVRPGLSRHQLVVLAARDALSVPDATGSAADTAALMEVAHVLAGRATQRTVVLASVDGGALGDAGARRLLARLPDPSLVDGVLVLSNMGAARSHGPLLVDWSNDARRGNLGLRRTASDALRNELGADGGPAATAPAQVARLALPVGLGAQGVFLAHGIDAIRLSGSGERAPPASRRALRELNPGRYGELGRAALRIVTALDGSRELPPHGPTTYVVAGGGMMPGWALELVAAALILPALVASVDALARARRRHEPVLEWLEWVVAGTLPFALGLGLAELLGLVGLARDAPPTPLDPSVAPVNGRAVGDMAVVALAVLAAWVLLRTRLIRRERLPDPGSPGAGVALAVVLCAVAVLLWAFNPFAALLFALPLNCWMLAGLARFRPTTRAWVVALGLLPAALVAATYMRELDLGPVEWIWYLFLLVTGGQVGVPSTLLGCLAAGCFGAACAIVVARVRAEPRRAEPEAPPGPALPGAIGPATRLEGAPEPRRRSLLRR